MISYSNIVLGQQVMQKRGRAQIAGFQQPGIGEHL